ncbi:hypothetical protein [Brevibacterium sp. UCMA 11752]|uniref:hypothetical protein n=1 Tax=Brevibacterium sp. UCMA 11752 TaxID=2745946 RepID=UPI001F274DD7|nr:hypothetical protein [Brevibacterium sp. UCMA 11752]MCF2585819.1 hypothetical protein [Brevibacterium sp. UCMA 11752]
MVLESDGHDRHFIRCDLDALRWRDSEWFCLDGVNIRTPREDPGSAVIILGPSEMRDLSAVENVPGWVLAVYPEDSCATAGLIAALLVRLGIERRFAVAFVHDGSWRFANVLRELVPELFVIFLRQSLSTDNSAVDDGKVIRNSETESTISLVHSSPELEQKSVFLVDEYVPFAGRSSRLVRYPSRLVMSDVPGGLRRLISLLAGVVASLRGQGDPASYLYSVFTHRGFPPSEEWLMDAAGESSIVRSSAVRLSLEAGGLLLYGFDVRQTLLAHSWSARRHEFRLLLGDSVVFSEPLGALRREILDTLPIHIEDMSNSYGAFSFRNAEALDLNSMEVGRYEIQIIDEFGDNMLGRCHRKIATAEYVTSTVAYNLIEELDGVSLSIGRVG